MTRCRKLFLSDMRSVTRGDSYLEMSVAKQDCRKRTGTNTRPTKVFLATTAKRLAVKLYGYTVLPSSSLWKRSFPNAETFSSCSFFRCTSTGRDAAKGSQHNVTVPRGSRRSSEKSADLCARSRRPRGTGAETSVKHAVTHVVQAWSMLSPCAAPEAYTTETAFGTLKFNDPFAWHLSCAPRRFQKG